MLHANPTAAGGAAGSAGAAARRVVGLFFVFNPTDATIVANMSVPLYYTGLETTASVRQGGVNVASDAAVPTGAPAVVTLRRDYSVLLALTVPAASYTWYEVAAD